MNFAAQRSRISDRVEVLLRAVLGSGPPDWTELSDPAVARLFLQRAHDEGVLPLLYERVRAGDAEPGCPGPVREALQAESRKRAALQAIRDKELEAVLQALAARGIQPLLFKGVPLAHLVYPAPHLRPCIDTDLLVKRDDADTAGEVLADRGYRAPDAVPGEYVLRQRTWVRADPGSVTHTCDVHWAVSYRELFAQMLPYEELFGEAIPVPALGEEALTVSHPHAVLLACIHRLAHHARSDRVVWLYDIHLLLQCMDPHALRRMLDLAREKRVRTLCGDGVQRARCWFNTTLPDGFLEELEEGEAGADAEPSAVYLRRERSGLSDIVTDVRAMSSWSGRARLLREHLVPPADYIARKYGVNNRLLLPVYYLRRALAGAWRRLRPRPARLQARRRTEGLTGARRGSRGEAEDDLPNA